MLWFHQESLAVPCRGCRPARLKPPGRHSLGGKEPQQPGLLNELDFPNGLVVTGHTTHGSVRFATSPGVAMLNLIFGSAWAYRTVIMFSAAFDEL